MRIDLRNIRSPILCFCSKGDNITPPQQALGWIVDLYEKDDDIRAGGQTIVYAIHESVGHLGIFVSGGVARKEHDEFASNIDLIDVLPPGLYEAVMTPQDRRDGPSGPGRRRLDRALRAAHPGDSCARSSSPIPRTSAASPPRGGSRRSTSACIARCCSPSSGPLPARRSRSSCMRSTRPSCRTSCSRTQPADAAGRRAGRAGPPEPASRWRPTTRCCSCRDMISDGSSPRSNGLARLRIRSSSRSFSHRLRLAAAASAGSAMRASDEPPRRHPGVEPERIAFVQQRIAEIKARVAEGGRARSGASAAWCTSAWPGRAWTSARSTNCARSAPSTAA